MRRITRAALLASTMTLLLASTGAAPRTAPALTTEVIESATCTGSASCRACKNCRYCKHCAKRGGTCGVCR